MSTIYMRQLSTLPLMEGDQDQGLFPVPFHVAKDPPILFPFMITNPVHVDQLQGQSSYGDQHLRQHVLSESAQQFTDRMMMSGSEVFPRRPSSPFRSTIQSIDGDMIQRSVYDPYDIVVENKRTQGLSGSGGGGPRERAKMKIMRKARNEYRPEGGAARKPRRRAQAHQDESQLLMMQQQQQQAMGGVVVRVCSDCNTTKTPLWRSGPCGPKSLCNACGIRQRKARRAMAAAAAAAASNGGGAPPPQAVSVAATQQPKPAKKEKRSDVDRSLPFKKRCKMVAADHAGAGAAAMTDEATTTPETAALTKDQADHVSSDKVAAAAMSLESKIAATPPPPPTMSFHAFPADEITDAAMLLMTLSCGLVHTAS